MDGMDKLFRRKVSATLGSDENAIKVTVRVLSDLDVQRRDEYSLLAMARRRKELDDKTSTAYEVFISGIETAPDGELKSLLMMAKESALRREANRQYQPQLLPFPEDATDEEKANVLTAREDEVKRISALIEEFVAGPISKFKEEIDNYSRETLMQNCKFAQLEEQARLASLRAFQDYTVYASTFTDESCTKRMFDSASQVSEVEPGVRVGLISFYFNRVDTVMPIDLKRFLSMDDSTDTLPASSLQDGKAEKAQKQSRGGGHKRG